MDDIKRGGKKNIFEESQKALLKRFGDVPKQQPASAVPTSRWWRRRSSLLALISVGVAVLVLLGSLIIYRSHERQFDLNALTKEIGTQVALPDEEPTVATVTDPKSLTSEFFKDAKVGDKILIYSEAKKALLYRPSTKKVIAIGPLLR